MRHHLTPWLLTLLTLLAGCSGPSSLSTVTSPSGAAALAELEILPVGLKVIHTPSKVSDPDGPLDEGWTFRWDFQTEVHAIDRPLTVIYFGIAVWDGQQWIVPDNTGVYDAGLSRQSDFIEWFSCPGARISPGKPAVDPECWAGSITRTSFRQRWFFVAQDDQKKRFKGEAVVDLLDGD